MANRNQSPTAARVSIPKTARKTTSALPPTRKIVEGGQIVGVFQKAKVSEIHDTNTKELKPVMIYTFRDPQTGEIFSVLGGRVGLDNAFENLFLELGGQEKVVGMMVAIERGEDIERSGAAGVIGTYDVYAWVPEKQ